MKLTRLLNTIMKKLGELLGKAIVYGNENNIKPAEYKINKMQEVEGSTVIELSTRGNDGTFKTLLGNHNGSTNPDFNLNVFADAIFTAQVDEEEFCSGPLVYIETTSAGSFDDGRFIQGAFEDFNFNVIEGTVTGNTDIQPNTLYVSQKNGYNVVYGVFYMKFSATRYAILSVDVAYSENYQDSFGITAGYVFDTALGKVQRFNYNNGK